jgi:hypothetical protein
MDAQSMKLEHIKLLLEIDGPILLEKLRQLLEPSKTDTYKKGIVGLKPNGEPPLQGEISEQLNASVEQACRGEVVAHENLVKDAENW